MALLAVNVKEADGIGDVAIAEGVQPHGVDAAADVLVLPAHLAHTAQVALDVRQKHRNPMSLKDSATTFSVTVLPVAPAMRPWRLAMPGSR